jgi:uncharacterized protein
MLTAHHRPRAVHLLVAILVLAGIALGLAQGTYRDPAGRFEVPVPSSWSDSSGPDHATFTLAEPLGVIHVVAAVGDERTVRTAGLQILVDPGLDADFVASPLQETPVGLPSGTWTQRIYLLGEDLIAAITLEQDGVTYLVLSQGTQIAYGAAINTAVNQVLLGLELATAEPPEPAEPPPYAVTDVTFRSAGITLAGTLTLPDGPGPHPAIVLVSGSGAQDRDGVNPSLPGYAPSRWLADHLTRHGVAVLRFDERGIGASGGDHHSASTADLADDVEAAVGFLRGHDAVDRWRVGILGHSEGGVIAAMVAARRPEVAFVISMAGSAVPYAELVVTQVERISEAMGLAPEEVEEATRAQLRAMELALAEDWDAVEELVAELTLAQLETFPEPQREALGDLEAVARQQAAAQVAAFQEPWLSFFLRHDPAADWRRVTVPVLALFGELDVQVDVDQNLAALRSALSAAGNDDLTVVVFEDANHLFQRAVTGGPDEYVTLEMAFLPGFLGTISDWLAARFGAREP